MFLIDFPGIENGLENHGVFLFCWGPEMILRELKNGLFFDIVMWANFYYFLDVKKFKYSVLPHWYSYKKLTNLAWSFDIVDFALILNASFYMIRTFFL